MKFQTGLKDVSNQDSGHLFLLLSKGIDAYLNSIWQSGQGGPGPSEAEEEIMNEFTRKAEECAKEIYLALTNHKVKTVEKFDRKKHTFQMTGAISPFEDCIQQDAGILFSELINSIDLIKSMQMFLLKPTEIEILIPQIHKSANEIYLGLTGNVVVESI